MADRAVGVKRLGLAAALAFLAAPRPAAAWWDYGHRFVASLAWADMTPRARREVHRLVRAAPALDTPTCRMASLEDAAVWPDCVKALKPRFDYATRWHFADAEVCQDFDPAPGCAGDDCVIAQIPKQTAILADRHRPAAERLQALAFVAHFVGDIHQPLHVGEEHDQGGNKVPVTFGALTDPKLNLHAIWDGPMVERALTDPPGGVAGVRAAISREEREDWAAVRVVEWARESWATARAFAYPLLGAGDSCAAAWPPSARVTVPATYYDAARPIIRDRIARAGVRLGALLNATLGR